MSIRDVQPGQIWADNDPRSAGRTLRVDAIEDGKAVCTILTNSDETQEIVDARTAAGYAANDRRGSTTHISLSRFKPTRAGYRLIQGQQYGVRWGADNDVVYAYSSREDAWTAIREDSRGIGILVVCEYEPDTPNRTEWRAVED